MKAPNINGDYLLKCLFLYSTACEEFSEKSLITSALAHNNNGAETIVDYTISQLTESCQQILSTFT